MIKNANRTQKRLIQYKMTVFQSFLNILKKVVYLQPIFSKERGVVATNEVYVFNRVKPLKYFTKSTFLGAVYGIEIFKTSSSQLITIRTK